jgi:hypothetical protein
MAASADVRRDQDECTRVKPLRRQALYDVREPPPAWNVYRRTHTKPPYRKLREQVSGLPDRMPASTSVTSAATVSPLLVPEQAVSVEQPDRDPATGNANHLADGSALIFDEAEGRDARDEVEAVVSVR